MSNPRIRPARATDRPAVVAICGDEDYIPREWDEWLADPHGELAVAEADGRFKPVDEPGLLAAVDAAGYERIQDRDFGYSRLACRTLTAFARNQVFRPLSGEMVLVGKAALGIE